MDVGADYADHAAAGPDADDRRLSAHPGDADRRRHLLRHPVHHPRTGTAFPGADTVSGSVPGLASATAMWTGQGVLSEHREPVFGSLADKVPQEFIADREKLRGAKFDIAAMTAAIPQMRDQFRAHCSGSTRSSPMVEAGCAETRSASATSTPI
jgi:hypothetical protein